MMCIILVNFIIVLNIHEIFVAERQATNYQFFFIRFTIFHILNGCHIWSRNFPEHLISTPVFSGVHIALFLVFCVVFCRSMFVLFYFFPLAIVLSVLRFTPSDYLFWIIYHPTISSISYKVHSL
jgi:hypothetical protein